MSPKDIALLFLPTNIIASYKAFFATLREVQAMPGSSERREWREKQILLRLNEIADSLKRLEERMK